MDVRLSTTSDFVFSSMPDPLRIAVVSTFFHPKSHTDVVVSRWAEPRPIDREYGWTAFGINPHRVPAC